MNSFEILSVNVSLEKGTEKHPVPEVEVSLSGLEGDAHAGDWHRQVSLLDSESIEAFALKTGLEITPGDFGENITTRGGDFSALAPGDRLSGEDGLSMVVTQLGKECHGDGCSIYRRVGKCVMPARGVFCRVESPGVLREGASLTVTPPESGRGE
jgi:MOSC domain-containing protein YiiM